MEKESKKKLVDWNDKNWKMQFVKLEAFLNLGQEFQPSFPFLSLYI